MNVLNTCIISDKSIIRKQYTKYRYGNVRKTRKVLRIQAATMSKLFSQLDNNNICFLRNILENVWKSNTISLNCLQLLDIPLLSVSYINRISTTLKRCCSSRFDIYKCKDRLSIKRLDTISVRVIINLTKLV